LPVSQQAEAINQKLRGHYSYYGVTGNIRALELLHEGIKRIWHKWLGRRSNRPLPWEQMAAILKVFSLARPRIVYSVYPRVANPSPPIQGIQENGKTSFKGLNRVSSSTVLPADGSFGNEKTRLGETS